jgi:Uma2 family endonuclease
MLASATLVSLGEYLSTSYRPDRDYVDGQMLERNAGEWDHSRLQALLLKLLVAPEQRVQVKASRFRVPDLCVVPGNPGEQILTRPPKLVIEILSPEDSMSAMQERIDDYLAFGIGNIWIFDPRRKKAYWADPSGVHEAVSGLLETSGAPIVVDTKAFWS